MTDLGGQLLHALGVAFAVLWEILWAPILSFGLSAAVQAWFPREMRKLLPDDSLRSLDPPLSGRRSRAKL